MLLFLLLSGKFSSLFSCPLVIRNKMEATGTKRCFPSCSQLGILQNNPGHWGKNEVKDSDGLVFPSCFKSLAKKGAALCSTKPISFLAHERLNQRCNWRNPAEIETGERIRSKPTCDQTC